jgi:hypothetical protein
MHIVSVSRSLQESIERVENQLSRNWLGNERFSRESERVGATGVSWNVVEKSLAERSKLLHNLRWK